MKHTHIRTCTSCYWWRLKRLTVRFILKHENLFMLFSKYTFTVFSVFCLLYLSISEGRASPPSTPSLHDITHSQDVFYVIQRLFSVSQSGCCRYTISTTSDPASDSCQRNGEREWVLFGCVCRSGSLSDDRKPSQVIMKGMNHCLTGKMTKGEMKTTTRICVRAS